MKQHHYRINGKVVTQEEFFKNRIDSSYLEGLTPTQCYDESHPRNSIAMSVHPDEIPMMNEFVRTHGIRGVEFDPRQKHNCVITSKKGRADFMRARGLTDIDGGYGDV